MPEVASGVGEASVEEELVVVAVAVRAVVRLDIRVVVIRSSFGLPKSIDLIIDPSICSTGSWYPKTNEAVFAQEDRTILETPLRAISI
jgi:hypothetical protein